MILFRVLILAGVVALLYFIFKSFAKPSPYIRCERCEGKGYWYGARGREKCDWCKGEGKMPNHIN